MTPANGDPDRQTPRSVDEALELTYRRARRIRRRRWAPPLTGAAAVLAGLLALVLVPGPGGSEVADVVGQANPTAEPSPTPQSPTRAPTPEPTPAPAAESPAPTPTPVPEAAQRAEADCGTWTLKEAEPPEGMEMTLELDGAVFAQGEEVRMTLRAENTSAGPIENEYTPPRGSFWVEDRDHQVWRWSRGRGFPQAVTEETFAPGEEKTEAVVWAQRLCNPDYPDESGAPVFREGPPPPGRYTAWGVWATHNVPKHATGPHAWWATPVTFEIVADS